MCLPDVATLPQSAARYGLSMTSMGDPDARALPEDVVTQLSGRLSVLDDLDGLPLAEHPDVYQQLHADLQATLAEIDTA